jgi:hydrogenase nickel incorporation protein HypA/HybF
VHELSIALGILDAVREESERHRGRVVAVHLRLGPLSGVVRESLALAYDLARQDTPLAEAELIVEEVPIVAYCPVCDVEVTCPSPREIRCPGCGAPTPVVYSGRELELVALEIEP